MLKLLTLPHEQTQCARLPNSTSANDIREFVQYLKRKPAGVVAAEELDRSRRRLFDERKLEAYRNLGITEEDDRLVMLSPFGRNLAERLEPETQGFRQLLYRNPLYLAAIKWMRERNLEVVTSTDIVAFWLSLHDEVDELHEPESSKGAAISFFSLCEAAELGTLTLGKRGHITRLRVDHQELARFVECDSAESLNAVRECQLDYHKVISSEELKSVCAVSKKQPDLKVLIIKSGNTALVDLIRRTLEITQVESLWIERDWSAKTSIANDLYQYANDYDALLVILDEESFAEDEPGSYRIKQKMLMEIGAALALFRLRVIVLGDKQFVTPEGVHNIIYQFEKNTLPWEVGLELINTIEAFKTEVCQDAV